MAQPRLLWPLRRLLAVVLMAVAAGKVQVSWGPARQHLKLLAVLLMVLLVLLVQLQLLALPLMVLAQLALLPQLLLMAWAAGVMLPAWVASSCHHHQQQHLLQSLHALA